MAKFWADLIRKTCYDTRLASVAESAQDLKDQPTASRGAILIYLTSEINTWFGLPRSVITQLLFLVIKITKIFTRISNLASAQPSTIY